MRIEEITIKTGALLDTVILHLDCPAPPPGKGRAEFRADVEAGKGLQYARLHFPNVTKAVENEVTGEKVRGYL